MSKSKQLAIDVILLLPPKIRDHIIALNERTQKQAGALGKLGKTDFVPHISLAMGGLKIKDLKKFKQTTEKIVKNFLIQHKKPLVIKIHKTFQRIPTKSAMFLLAESTPLKKLHCELMRGLDQFFTHNCTKNDIYCKSGEKREHPKITNIYKDKFSFKNYLPHITLRTSMMPKIKLPINFKIQTLAVYQVGIATTCRKRLFSLKLAKY